MIQLSGAGKRFGHKLLFENVDWLITNHDHIGHAAAFLRVADARDSFEATKACPAFGPSPDQGSPRGTARPP